MRVCACVCVCITGDDSLRLSGDSGKGEERYLGDAWLDPLRAGREGESRPLDPVRFSSGCNPGPAANGGTPLWGPPGPPPGEGKQSPSDPVEATEPRRLRGSVTDLVHLARL
jgi:hypothetical protein